MDNKNLLILGAGQYGFVARDTARAMGCFRKIDFLDDHSEIAIGTIAGCAAFRGQYECAFVAIGNPETRQKLIRLLEQAGFELPVLVHPRAVVMPSASVSEATIVEAQAVVNSNAEVGAGCIISAGAVVNHNSVLGACCHIDCNATVPARSVLPERTKVSCGTVYDL